MKKFKFTLRRKILATFVPTLLLLLLMGVIAANQTRVVNLLLAENYNDSTVNIKLLGDAIQHALRTRERLILVVISTAPSEQVRQFEAMRAEAEKLTKLIDEYEKGMLQKGMGHELLLADFKEAWSQALKTSDQVARTAMAGQYEQAELALTSSAQSQLNHAVALLQLLQDVEDNTAVSRFVTSQVIGQRVGILLSGLTVAASLIAVLLAVWLSRSMGTRLIDLTQTANEIAAGNWDRRAKVGGDDEIGQLAGAFNRTAAQIQSVLQEMEQRVALRTRDLSLAAEVGHRVSTVRDRGQLLAESVELIRSQFDLYYAQIYLAGADGRQLKLAAGTGAAGEALLQRGHQLAVGPGSINGSAAARREAVAVPDTAISPIFRPNPLLPQTRSEMAVPMVVGDRLIGVLNLQDRRPNSLTRDNLDAFQTVATQLAIALENARLLVEATQAHEAMAAQARFLARGGWDVFLDAVHRREWLGYAYDAEQVQPLAAAVSADAETAATPITVSGEPIGAIWVEPDEARPLTPEDNDLVAAVARQVAERVENLRLLAEADRYRDEAETAVRRATLAGWESFQESTDNLAPGYLYDHTQVRPVTGEVDEPITLKEELVVQGQTIGELGLVGGEADDEQTIGLLQSVAEYLSLHIDNLRLARQTEEALTKTAEQARRLAALNEMANELGTVDTLDEVFAAVARHLDNIVAHDRLGLTLLEPDGERLQLFIVDGESGVTQADMTVSAAGSAVGQAIAQRRLINTTDIVQRDSGEDEEAAAPGMRASLVAPLITARGVLGTLNMGSNTPDAFDDQDENVMQQIAPLLASTVENLRLFTAAQKQAEKEHLVNVITQKIQGTVTMESALQTTIQELGQALQARYTQVKLTTAVEVD